MHLCNKSTPLHTLINPPILTHSSTHPINPPSQAPLTYPLITYPLTITSSFTKLPFTTAPHLPSHHLPSPPPLPSPPSHPLLTSPPPPLLLDREGVDGAPSSTPTRKPSTSSTLRPGTLTTLEELRNTHNQGRYQRVAGWNLQPAQGVTALSGVNSVPSPLIFCATSDRKIHVLDAAVGCIARSMDCGHDRSVHHIALPSPRCRITYPYPPHTLVHSTIHPINIFHQYNLSMYYITLPTQYILSIFPLSIFT